MENPNNPDKPASDTSLDQRLLTLCEQLSSTAHIQERRVIREERWNNLKMFFIFLLVSVPIIVYSIGFTQYFQQQTEDHVGVLRLDGTISAASNTTSGDVLSKKIHAIMDKKSAKGLILVVNSPGGSPAQSDIIRRAMLDARAAHPEKKLLVLAEDLMASGGYWVATGADEIYAMPTSLVGSIGVIHQSFGFQGVLDRFDVESRTLATGSHKDVGSMYRPWTDQDRGFIQGMLDDYHQLFVDVVRDARGDKLSDTPDIFSGRFWVGQKALDLGLIDGFADLDTLLRDHFNEASPRFYVDTPFQQALSMLGASVQTLFGWGVSTPFQAVATPSAAPLFLANVGATAQPR